MTRANLIIALPFALLSLSWAGIGLADETVAKAAIPSEETQNEVKKLIEQIYKVSQAKTIAEQSDLALRLIHNAVAQNEEVANRYVLLQTAGTLALQAGNPEVAFQAVDELSNRFELKDPLSMQLSVAEKLSDSAKAPESRTILMSKVFQAITTALSKDRYDIADKLARLNVDIAKKLGNGSLSQQAESQLTLTELMKNTYADVEAAKRVLADTPDDPAANLKVGRFLCLYKDDWRRGVSMLALSDDVALSTIAAKELLAPKDSKDQETLGDGWWGLAENEKEFVKQKMQARAEYWYRQALPGLAGLAKAKVAARIEEISKLSASQQSNTVPAKSVPPPFVSRFGDAKKQVLDANGGTVESDAAVNRGLDWLLKHQEANGSWRFDGKVQADGTGMALLPFLGAGHTHQSIGPFQQVIQSGLKSLLSRNRDGSFLAEGGTFYVQGINSLALVELYGLTNDKSLRRPAQQTMDFIVAGQCDDGGWRYEPRAKTGDISVTGWNVAALRLGLECGLKVPPKTFVRVKAFLDKAQANKGATYGYDSPGAGRSTTASGLLMRLSTRQWKSRIPALNAGVAFLTKNGPTKRTNLYHDYFATQVMFHYGGDEWAAWNGTVRDFLVQSQLPEGNWSFDEEQWQPSAGQVYTTSIAILILETCYRYPRLLAE